MEIKTAFVLKRVSVTQCKQPQSWQGPCSRSASSQLEHVQPHWVCIFKAAHSKWLHTDSFLVRLQMRMHTSCLDPDDIRPKQIVLLQVFNAVIGRMVSAVLWVSPLGVASLIAAAICNACDLLGTAAALGLWIGTVLGGLAIFAGLLLPALLWAVTRCNPFQTLQGFAPALLLGFGTGSSAASLPVRS